MLRLQPRLGGLLATSILFAAPLFAQDVAEWGRRLGGGDVAMRREAAYQLGRLGPPAAAALPALLTALDDSDKQVWFFALTAITNLGPDAKAAIPDLLRRLESSPARSFGRDRDRQRQTLTRVAFALSQMGAAARPALIEALQSPVLGRRQGAARALASMGPEAAEAIPALIAALTDNDLDVRREVQEALGSMGAAAVEPLAQAVRSSNPGVRTASVTALGEIGLPARDIAPSLLDLLEQERDTGARIAFLGALPRVSAPIERLVPLLIAGIGDDDESIRHAALNALVPLRSARKPTLTALIALLTEGTGPAVPRAARALGRIGPDALVAVPAILAASRKAPSEGAFADALSEIGPAALPAILAALSAENRPDQERLVAVLGNFGAPAVSSLLEALQDPNVQTRSAAGRALGSMGSEARAAIAPLLVRAADSDGPVRAAALQALVALRVEPRELDPLLEKALRDTSPEVRLAGTAGLAARGKTDFLAVSALVDLLTQGEGPARLTGVEALGRMGDKAASSIPALTARLDDPGLQIPIIVTLGKIGPSAASTVPRLLELAKPAGTELQAAILTALAGIGPGAIAGLSLAELGVRSPEPETRSAATRAFGVLESDPNKVLSVLAPLLSDERGSVRRAAAGGLAKLGDRARSIAPALLAMTALDADRPAALEALKAVGLQSMPELLRAAAMKDPGLRIFACEQLALLGPAAQEAIPRLRELAEDSKPEVKEAARMALGKIEPRPL